MEVLSSTKHQQSWLSWFFRGLTLLVFLVLLARLVDLQIIRGAYFRKLAEGNRIRRVAIAAPRGQILAREGEVVVGNIEVKKGLVFDPIEGYKKTDDLTNAKSEELVSDWMRSYKIGSAAAHITGYLGEAMESEVGKVRSGCPDKGPRQLGSYVGRTGLEEYYDCVLSGIDGEELVEVDSSGKKIRSLGVRQPIPGQDVTTSLDFKLQKKVAELMADKIGVVIVTNEEGQVLALYSSPSYDPGLFVDTRVADKLVGVLEDKRLPLFNRAIGGTFHPGSVFKPVVAIAALEEQVIDDDYVYEDTGSIVIKTLYGTFSYGNWYFSQYGGVEGTVDLTRALTRSTDTFFYKVGEELGVDKLVSWAKNFGFDRKTGIDIPGEVIGLVPSPQWKQEVKGERWFLGNTYHYAIGQGDLAVTPIELNTAISIIALNGKYCHPRIASQSSCEFMSLNSDNVSLVKEGMRGACLPEGTGYTFFDFSQKADGVTVGCKTGTAEVDGSGDTHAWFTAFAPLESPEIVATVLVERGGEGSRVAGPIARDIFNHWFNVVPSRVQSSITPTPAGYE